MEADPGIRKENKTPPLSDVMWFEMTLNFRMMVGRYPNFKDKVGGLIPDFEISSLLHGKLVRWSTASCALTLACQPSVSNKQTKNLRSWGLVSKQTDLQQQLFLHVRGAWFRVIMEGGPMSLELSYFSWDRSFGTNHVCIVTASLCRVCEGHLMYIQPWRMCKPSCFGIFARKLNS